MGKQMLRRYFVSFVFPQLSRSPDRSVNSYPSFLVPPHLWVLYDLVAIYSPELTA